MLLLNPHVAHPIRELLIGPRRGLRRSSWLLLSLRVWSVGRIPWVLLLRLLRRERLSLGSLHTRMRLLWVSLLLWCWTLTAWRSSGRLTRGLLSPRLLRVLHRAASGRVSLLLSR